MVEFQINKKIYNASKDIINQGGNALDVLTNTPSVRVGPEGSIMIRGASPTILIDGKPQFNLGGTTDFLKSLPSNSIDKVEIITRSAKYSASGGAILNIITKKKKDSGLTGSFELHTGIPDNHGFSSFLNENNGKMNLYSTISFNHSDKERNIDIEQPLLNLFEKSIQNRQRNSVLFNIGSDFYLNENNTLTISFLINNNDKNIDYSIVENDFNRNSFESDNSSKIETKLGYQLKLNDKGQKLDFNFGYENTAADTKADILETITLPQNSVFQKSIKDQTLDNFLAQLDYTLPFDEDKSLEVGYKGTFRKYRNDYNVSQFDEMVEDFFVLEDFDAIFNYNETIHGVYALYNATKDKWLYSLGLRTEISNITLKNIDDNQKKNYTDLFPSFFIGYELNDNSYISASYNRSIDRPLESQLNPFNSFAYQRFQSVGNKNLNPYYTDYGELLFDSSFGKFTVAASVFLNYQKDQFLSIIQNSGFLATNGDEIFKRTFINSGDKNIIGADLDITYKPFKGLRINGYISPYRQEITNALDATYNLKNTVWYAEGAVFISLNEGLKLNISHKYQSAIINGLTELKPINFTNATISKDLFNKNATLAFKAVDIFKNKRFNYVSTEANTITKHNVFYQNQYSLSFSYRFNQKRRSKKDRSLDIDKDQLEDNQDKKM